jgi:hypothetical protein
LKMNYEYPEEGRHPSGVEEDLWTVLLNFMGFGRMKEGNSIIVQVSLLEQSSI